MELDFCIDALRGALQLSKQAIQIEIAVSIVVFHAHDGDTGIAAMKALRGIYAAAGRVDCLTPDSPSYHTVARRIRRCAAFYETLTHKKVKRVLKDKTGDEALKVVQQHIEPMEITSMDDLAARSGKPRERRVDAIPHTRRASDAPNAFHLRTEHIDVTIPPDATPAEMLDLAKKLTALAKGKPVG